MIKSVKISLKTSSKNKFKHSEEERKGLLVFEGEYEHKHEVALMMMHSFGTVDFSNQKNVDADILVCVYQAIANTNRDITTR